MPLADVPDRQLEERDGLLLPQVEHVGDRLDDQRRIADARQFHEPDAVIVRAQLGRGGLDRQAGLAGAAGTGQRERATARQQPFDVAHLALPTNEAAELDWQVVRASPTARGTSTAGPGECGGGPPRRPLAAALSAAVRAAAEAALEDVAVQLFALIGRFDPELAPKDGAQPLVLAEGQQPPAAERVQPHQAAVGGSSAGSSSSSVRSDATAASRSPPRSCSSARRARTARSSWRERLARAVCPLGVRIIGQEFASVEVMGGPDRRCSPTPAASRSRGDEASASTQSSVRAETEDPVAQDQDALDALVERTEGDARNSKRLVEVVHAGVRRAIRPQVLDDLLAVQPMAGVSASSFTSSLALRRRQAAAGTGRPSTSTSNPPSRRTRTDGEVPPDPAWPVRHGYRRTSTRWRVLAPSPTSSDRRRSTPAAGRPPPTRGWPR